MSKKIVPTKNLPPAKGPYSQCVIGRGSRMVFISGQVPQDERGVLAGKGNITEQTAQVLLNLKRAVEAAGGTVEDICKITIFVVRLDDDGYHAVAEARRTFFGGDYPASTMMEVNKLASPDWLIEIEGYAVI